MLLRERFPIFRDKIYLNSCSQGALSSEVMRAYDAYLQDWQTLGSPWDLWVEKGETARQTFAALINAHPEEIAVSTSVSAALSALASALDFSGERNRIVVSDFEFPTVAQIWHAQEARGAEVVHVPVAGNSIPPEQFADAIDDRTKLVAITHVCYRNGVRLDIPAIVEIAHQKGALVVLDSYQALGTFPIDVKALQVDFLGRWRIKISPRIGGRRLYGRQSRPDFHPKSQLDRLVCPARYFCDGYLRSYSLLECPPF